jgi:acyl-CoA synthetase (AMP-forming)/AMP-acid ligase II
MKALSADAPTGSPLDSQPMPRGGHVLDDVLMRQVQDRPEALALQFEGRAFSYGRLARRTERAAARLWHPWGVRTGDRVAWLGLNHVDQITLLFALARIGAVLVPLNFRLAQRRMAGGSGRLHADLPAARCRMGRCSPFARRGRGSACRMASTR